MRFKPLFQLVRLPNVFTAAADSLAGWLIVGGSLHQPKTWLPLSLASMALYASGMAMNDVCDLEVDRIERPNRPLPAGLVHHRFAVVLIIVLLALAVVLASLAGRWAGLTAALLGVVITSYNFGVKHTPFGPWNMGACRGLNVAMGMVAVTPNFVSWTWCVPIAIMVFVAGVTYISRLEMTDGARVGLARGIVLENLALAGLAALLLGLFAHSLSAGRSGPGAPLGGLAVLLTVALFVNGANRGAFRRPQPATIQAAVKAGVLSLVWLDAAVVAGARGPNASLAIAACWIPAYVLGKWLYST